jgi:hypothetical protein
MASSAADATETEGANRALGVACLLLEHRVPPADDGPQPCKTPHLALGAGGACVTAPESGTWIGRYRIRPPSSVPAPFLTRGSGCSALQPILAPSPPSGALKRAVGWPRPGFRVLSDGRNVNAVINRNAPVADRTNLQRAETTNRATDDSPEAPSASWRVDTPARRARATRLENIGTRLPGRTV